MMSFRFYTAGFFVALISMCMWGIHTVRAQESLVLSVTPPLFQLSVEPGDVWQSSVKVINSNLYDITVFAEVVDFEPQGEYGQGRFIPLVDQELAEASLAGWIDVDTEPIVIPAESSREVPFFVTVPRDASPGGHFAAILIGTQPPEGSGSLAVQTSQVVTSLFFVRIGGDVVESGDIREFSVAHSFNGTPGADFILRFENKGNVHLQPQGDITIYNMWGKERGFIPINQKTNFGNVLPESVRRFEFSWKGEPSLADIGRYTAVVTLAFGEDNRNFVTRSVSFYVIPIKATLITVGLLLGFLFTMNWLIKRYIRRAIHLAGYEDVRPLRAPSAVKPAAGTITPPLKRRPSRDLKAPIRAGVIDLRRRIEAGGTTSVGKLKALWSFARAYRVFFAGVLVCLCAGVGGWFYLSDVLSDQKNYEVVVERPDGDVTINSEEVLKERLESSGDAPGIEEPSPASGAQEFTLSLINASDVPGTAAQVAIRLEEFGYRVDSIDASGERTQQRTVIVYDPSLESYAITLSEQLGGVLISARTDEASATSTPGILVVVGSDQS